MEKIDKIANPKIYIELKQTFEELLTLLASLTQEQLNKIPFEGSWTAGQVGDHLLKSYGVIATFEGNTEPTKRPPEEKVMEIKNIFLDFTVKFNSPEFIIPSNDPMDKETLLKDLKEKTDEIVSYTQNPSKDMSLTCLDFELPGNGLLTRLEWIHFVTYHTIRHVRQLKNIHNKVTKPNHKHIW